MAAAEGEGWAADVRIGVYKVLVSRSGQHQRHSALRLAAAVLELAQPRWVLGPIQPVTPRSKLHMSSARALTLTRWPACPACQLLLAASSASAVQTFVEMENCKQISSTETS